MTTFMSVFHLSGRVLPRLACCLALSALSAGAVQAAPIVFSDGGFVDGDWSTQQFLSGSVATSQVTTGGNPGAFRQTEHSGLNAGQSIIVMHLLSSAVYAPGASGAIANLDFSFDLRFLGGSAGTSTAGYRLGAAQGGSLFFSLGTGGSLLGVARGPGNGAPGNGWEVFSFAGLTAVDFARQAGTGQLDFSENGAPITFGFLTTNSVTLDNTSTRSGIDNWRVSVSPVPLPATAWLLATGFASLGWRRATRRE